VAIAQGKGNLALGKISDGTLSYPPGTFGDAIAATFADQGGHVGAITTRGDFVVWPLQPPSPPKNAGWGQLLQYLRSSVPVCLTTLERQQFLGESNESAGYNASHCQAGNSPSK
jgi:hypothetical protein